jgi:hypothetical protein
MKNAAIVCTHLLNYAHQFVPSLTDADLAVSREPGAKTIGWLLGHLCVTGDFVRRKSGRSALTPKEWGPLYGPGSKASASASDYPPMAVLVKSLNDIYSDLASFAPTLEEEILARPNPYEPATGTYRTLGEFAGWIMTGHLGYHLGQLSELRRNS